MNVPSTRRALVGIATLSASVGVAAAMRRRVTERQPNRVNPIAALDDAITGLTQAGLTQPYMTLAPAFRATRAGAGRPRNVSNEQLAAFCDLGLVICLKEPHVAAGYLDVYRLTNLGEQVYRQMAKAGDERSGLRATLSGFVH